MLTGYVYICRCVSVQEAYRVGLHIGVGFCVARSYCVGQCEGLYAWDGRQVQILRKQKFSDMKRLKFLALLIGLFLTRSVQAQDFFNDYVLLEWYLNATDDESEPEKFFTEQKGIRYGVYCNKSGGKWVAVESLNKGEYRGNITIPKSILYNDSLYDVVEIGDSAFFGCKDLLSVEIPETVRRINHYAFSGCSKMESILIPNSVEYIGVGAFKSCENLRDVRMSNKVESIEKYTFYHCRQLCSIALPISLRRIGAFAFAGCGFESVAIPKYVTIISNNAFSMCKELNVVTLEGKSDISRYVFSDCKNLQRIIFNSTIPPMAFGDDVFRGCDLSKIELTVPEASLTDYESKIANKFGWKGVKIVAK